jgi:2-octaprenyl-6-methoxyphenol hydroxylase
MFDVLIVGGGMVGASLACALGDSLENKNGKGKNNSSLKVGIIEPKTAILHKEFGADGRASAIALGSSQIWQDIGVWERMRDRGVTPMHCIQVSDGNYGQKVQLKREDIDQTALGYVVENSVTQSALWDFMGECGNIEVICPAQIVDIESGCDQYLTVKIMTAGVETKLTTKLLIGADGGRSLVRNLAKIAIAEKQYDQTCIVVTVKTEFPHHNIAYERFQASGPFAILPLPEGDRCCIVWTATKAEAPELLNLSEIEFSQELTKRFGSELQTSLGELTVETKRIERSSYSPRWMHAATYIQPRIALIGDAAHTTHPVAGQGMNLGIRDAGAIAEILLTAHDAGQDLGSLAVLSQYQNWRRWDNWAVITITDITNRLFSNQFPPLQWIRRIGLAIANLLPFKKVLMYFMMGLIGRQPNLPDRT